MKAFKTGTRYTVLTSNSYTVLFYFKVKGEMKFQPKNFQIKGRGSYMTTSITMVSIICVRTRVVYTLCQFGKYLSHKNWLQSVKTLWLNTVESQGTNNRNNNAVILSCVGGAWLLRRVFDWMLGFVSPYTFTQFGTIGNYSAIAILHTFISPLHTH
jgi:hypothetical protein